MTQLAKLVSLWALLGGVVLVLIVLVTTVNIGLFAVDRIAVLWDGDVAGLSGYEDFVRLAISAAALMFFPYCQLRRGHISVDIFADMMPRRVSQILQGMWLWLTAVLALFLMGWMWSGMRETREDGVLSPILGWPEWPFYLPGLVSLLLWATVAAAQAMGPSLRDGSDQNV